MYKDLESGKLKDKNFFSLYNQNCNKIEISVVNKMTYIHSEMLKKL